MVEEKAIGYGLCFVGLGISIWATASFFVKQRLINEYIDEAKAYREALIRAYENGVVTEDEQDFLTHLESLLARKEKTIYEAGLLPDLTEELKWVFGIVVAAIAYKVTSKLIETWWRRYRPPKPWKCEICGAEFGSEAELDDHVKEHEAVDDPAIFVSLWEALQETPGWFRNHVATMADIDIEIVHKPVEWFNELPDEQKIAIGVAVAIEIIMLVALEWWLGAISSIAIALSRAVACFV